MTLLDTTVDDIIDNYADVIEGGNAHRGSGDDYYGVPGLHSTSPLASLQVTATTGCTTTAIVHTGALAAGPAGDMARTAGPPLFLVGATMTSELNDGAGRRVTAYTSGTSTLTVGEAFQAAPTSGDVFDVREGFRRESPESDLMAAPDQGGVSDGFDRYFSLAMLPGVQQPWYGDDVQRWSTTLDLTVRFVKHGNPVAMQRKAVANVLLLCAALAMGVHRGDSGAQLVSAAENPPEKLVDTQRILVVRASLPLIYRVNAEWK